MYNVLNIEGGGIDSFHMLPIYNLSVRLLDINLFNIPHTLHQNSHVKKIM